MKELPWSEIKMLVLDFDGVMTDGFVYVGQDGHESIRASRLDGLGIEMIQRNGIQCVVISREKNPVVEARCKKLKLKYFHGALDKKKIFLGMLSELSIDPKNVCYVGDDIIDVECIELSGIGAVPSDAHSSALEVADYIAKAGRGNHLVREICDIILGQRMNSSNLTF
ncbi:MAG: KdsC family phosphatase [Minisyncoccota bacterium]